LNRHKMYSNSTIDRRVLGFVTFGLRCVSLISSSVRHGFTAIINHPYTYEL